MVASAPSLGAWVMVNLQGWGCSSVLEVQVPSKVQGPWHQNKTHAHTPTLGGEAHSGSQALPHSIATCSWMGGGGGRGGGRVSGEVGVCEDKGRGWVKRAVVVW